MSQTMPESPVTAEERFVALKQGRVFVKTWEPDGQSSPMIASAEAF